MLTNAEDDRYKDVPAARQALAKEFSLAVRADVDRVVVGKPSCDAYSTEPGCGRLEIVMPPENRCPLYESKNVMSELSMDQVRALRRDWRCTDRQFMQPRDTVVADEKLLTVLGVSDPGAVAALRSGQAVSFDRRNFKEGKVTMQVITDDARGPGVPGAGDQPKDVKVFPVYQAPDSVTGYGIEIVLPPGAVKAAGLGTAPFGTYFTLADKPTGAQRQALAAMIDRIGVDAPVRIEEGYQGRDSVEILALTIFAGLVTIGAAGIATGLAQADAEADLKTLAAVGAPPRVRRTLSGFQCGVVALMGVALGTAAGLLPHGGAAADGTPGAGGADHPLRLRPGRVRAVRRAVGDAGRPADPGPARRGGAGGAGDEVERRAGPSRHGLRTLCSLSDYGPSHRVDHACAGAHRVRTEVCERMSAWRCRGVNGRRTAPRTS